MVKNHRSILKEEVYTMFNNKNEYKNRIEMSVTERPILVYRKYNTYYFVKNVKNNLINLILGVIDLVCYSLSRYEQS